MGKKTNSASSRQLLEGAVAAFENARRLAADAKKLCQLDSAPTAYALSVLAMEEASKAFSWAAAAKNETVDEQEIPVPMELHADRLQPGQMVLETMRQHFGETEKTSDGELLNRARELAKKENTKKQRGFYVDLEDGNIQNPAQISQDEASEICEIAEGIIGIAMIGMIYLGSKRSE